MRLRAIPAIAGARKAGQVAGTPSVAALAKELLGAMKHPAQGDGKFLLQFDSGPGGKPGVLEFNIEPPPPAAKRRRNLLELKFDDLQFEVQQGGPISMANYERHLVGEAKTGGSGLPQADRR